MDELASFRAKRFRQIRFGFVRESRKKICLPACITTRQIRYSTIVASDRDRCRMRSQCVQSRAIDIHHLACRSNRIFSSWLRNVPMHALHHVNVLCASGRHMMHVACKCVALCRYSSKSQRDSRWAVGFVRMVRRHRECSCTSCPSIGIFRRPVVRCMLTREVLMHQRRCRSGISYARRCLTSGYYVKFRQMCDV